MPTALATVSTVTSTKKPGPTNGDDRGLSAWSFAVIMLAAFAVLAVCALVGGWAGLIGIVATAIILVGFAATRL